MAGRASQIIRSLLLTMFHSSSCIFDNRFSVTCFFSIETCFFSIERNKLKEFILQHTQVGEIGLEMVITHNHRLLVSHGPTILVRKNLKFQLCKFFSGNE